MISVLYLQKVPPELYGPTMIVFTLVALLLYQMKTGGHVVVSELVGYAPHWGCITVYTRI